MAGLPDFDGISITNYDTPEEKKTPPPCERRGFDLLFQFALKTVLIVGAALAAMNLGFAAKAAPTSGRIIVVFNEIWNYTLDELRAITSDLAAVFCSLVEWLVVSSGILAD